MIAARVRCLLTAGVGHGRETHARHCSQRRRTAYRFAWPRASFFTLRFFDPAPRSRGFFGFSALLFLREARLLFLRSSFVNFSVFAMIAFLRSSLKFVVPVSKPEADCLPLTPSP